MTSGPSISAIVSAELNWIDPAPWIAYLADSGLTPDGVYEGGDFDGRFYRHHQMRRGLASIVIRKSFPDHATMRGYAAKETMSARSRSPSATARWRSPAPPGRMRPVAYQRWLKTLAGHWSPYQVVEGCCGISHPLYDAVAVTRHDTTGAGGAPDAVDGVTIAVPAADIGTAAGMYAHGFGLTWTRRGPGEACAELTPSGCPDGSPASITLQATHDGTGGVRQLTISGTPLTLGRPVRGARTVPGSGRRIGLTARRGGPAPASQPA